MKLRDWITLGAAIVLIAGAFILGMRCRGGESQTVVLRVHDTLRISQIVRDTVLRWYERIVWKEAEPETVVVYADTIRPDTIWGRWPEAIISLDYSRGKLSFTSLLPVPDSQGAREGIIKDYSYKVGERFAIRTKGEGFHVRTKRSGPRFEVGVGSGVRLLGDTLQARVVPFIFASLVYRGLSLGPRLDTKGLHLCLSYRWSF
ncbi:hypothetical protein CEE36_05890 [candidate division TA06 bacterium B3_TA06]|uniref:Uncharacterized protein n=1 Tax=candidate division TA06 bacterium B3_TA06 TaxID=2012487 RepID=A0A532V741_UNCT6|nr:MAG: hypothetical protein CEE36_05890 [candidate division TA06 bacterium B3_TA06]